MKQIREWLINNSRDKEEHIELELLNMAINLYHIISLLWDKTTRKYTDNFIIYKTQELLEAFINNLPDDVPTEIVDERIKDARRAIAEDSQNDIEAILAIYGAEIDNFPGSQYGLTLDFKIGILLHLLNLKGISDKQIFEKYQN